MEQQKKIETNHPASARARAKKLSEKSLGDLWVASAVSALSAKPEDLSSSAAKPVTESTEAVPEIALSASNSFITSKFENKTGSSEVFELTANQSQNIDDGDEVTSIVVSADKKQKCQIRSTADHLQIHVDIQKLIVLRLQEIALSIRDLCASLLHIPPKQIHAIELLDIDQKQKSMLLGWEVTFPLQKMQGGKSRELQTCVETFVRALCGQEKWSNESLDSFPVGSGEREAVMAAQKLRKTRGDSELPDNSKIECRQFTSPINLGKKFGPPPEDEEEEKELEIMGAFRGFYRDERKSFFAIDGLVQTKAKSLQFKEDQFEEIRRLCTNEVTLCKVKIKQHWCGDSIDHLELMEVIDVVSDMFQSN